MNPNGRYPNNHARGTFTVEGWAAEWLRRHKEQMARLSPDQLQLYFQAMDQLYLQADKVNYNMAILTLHLIQKGFTIF